MSSSFFIGLIAFILYAVIIAPDGDQGYLPQLVRMENPATSLFLLFFIIEGGNGMCHHLLLMDMQGWALPFERGY